MKTYIISYNLSNSARNYSDFYDAIKTNMPENRHMLETAWIVKPDLTANEILKLLKPHLHFVDYDCDTIFVSEINNGNMNGVIASSLWPFITDKEGDDKEKAETK